MNDTTAVCSTEAVIVACYVSILPLLSAFCFLCAWFVDGPPENRRLEENDGIWIAPHITFTGDDAACCSASPAA